MVRARVGDGQALPYHDGTFDAAFSLFGVIFFPDRARGLAELRRVLVPGGRAVVTSWVPPTRVPLMDILLSALAQSLPGFPYDGRGGALSSPDDVRAELTAAGFSRVEVRELVHGTTLADSDAAWESATRSMAPLVLLARRLGPEAFAALAGTMRARLRERLGSGPVRLDLPALFGIATV